MDQSYFSYSHLDELSFGGEKIKDILKNPQFKLSDFKSYLPLEKKLTKNIEINYQL